MMMKLKIRMMLRFMDICFKICMWCAKVRSNKDDEIEYWLGEAWWCLQMKLIILYCLIQD